MSANNLYKNTAIHYNQDNLFCSGINIYTEGPVPVSHLYKNK